MATEALQKVQFELIPNWEKCPEGEAHKHLDVADVACDAQDRVFLHTRHGDRVMIYDEDGNFIKQWGDGVFNNAHGIAIHDDLDASAR